MASEPANADPKPERQQAFHEFVVNANITPIMDFLFWAKPADMMEAGNAIHVSFRVNLPRERQDEIERRPGIKPTVRFIVGEHIQREYSNPLGDPRTDFEVLVEPEVLLNFMQQCVPYNELPPSPSYDVVLRARLTPRIITDILSHSNLSPTLRYQSGDRLLSQQNIEDGVRLMAQVWAEETNTPQVSVKPFAPLPIEKADALGELLLLDGWLTYQNHLYQATKPETPLGDGGLETSLQLHGLEPSDLFEVAGQ